LAARLWGESAIEAAGVLSPTRAARAIWPRYTHRQHVVGYVDQSAGSAALGRFL